MRTRCGYIAAATTAGAIAASAGAAAQSAHAAARKAQRRDGAHMPERRSALGHPHEHGWIRDPVELQAGDVLAVYKPCVRRAARHTHLSPRPLDLHPKFGRGRASLADAALYGHPNPAAAGASSSLCASPARVSPRFPPLFCLPVPIILLNIFLCVVRNFRSLSAVIAHVPQPYKTDAVMTAPNNLSRSKSK